MPKVTISARRLRCYQAAENVVKGLRTWMGTPNYEEGVRKEAMDRAADWTIYWLELAGKDRYDPPPPVPHRWKANRFRATYGKFEMTVPLVCNGPEGAMPEAPVPSEPQPDPITAARGAEHVAAICNNKDCGGCIRCNCFLCAVCGLLEGSLTTHCPGVWSFDNHADSVYEGKEDYVDGAWVSKCSPCSPAFYRQEKSE